MVFGRLAKPWGAILSGFDSRSLRQIFGAMFELVMELVLKTSGEQSLGGSSPSRSAIFVFGRVFGIGIEPSSKDGGGNPIGVQVAALPPSLESCAELVMQRIGSASPQGISRSSRLLSAMGP